MPKPPVEAPAAEYVTLDRLTPWPKNPDPPSPKDVRTIARSIKRFGFGEPILARLANGEIIAGHARYLASRRLKLETVPVRWMDLSEDEAHVLALADNKIAANRKRDWDGEQIEGILDDLESKNVNLANGTGFTEEEIDSILEDEEATDALTAEEVAVDVFDTTFTLHVTGPTRLHPDVLEALQRISGIDVVVD
jgi:ParB-like chromosome segregation protein Spo0J